MRARLLALVSLGVVTFSHSAAAQFFRLDVATATNLVSVNDPVQFSLTLSNSSGGPLPNVFVTNAFTGSSSVQIQGTTANPSNLWSTITTSSGVSFNINQFPVDATAEFTVTVLPVSSGVFTNGVNVGSVDLTNSASTNVAVQVIPPAADLAVSLTSPIPPLLVNDWFNYGVAVTNLGTNSVGGVVLTNSGFDTLNLIGLSPSHAYTLTNGLLLLELGTLAGGSGSSFTISAQPTNAGQLTLGASVSGTNITEINETNNTASVAITVEDFVTGNLIATNVSTNMVYNPQTGLMEQTIRLVNVGTNSVASARVIVSGLTNQLYNAVGTNNGDPYVVYGAPLATNEGVNLLMEYFIPTRLPITVPNSAYTAVGTSTVDLSASSTEAPNVTLITNLVSGGVLIEFESIPNRSYTILYSDDPGFTNALVAQPTIIAPADRTQWIDNGPPKTVSHPVNASSRFYRVLLNP